MIKAEKVSWSFPDKDLYNEISFSIEEGQHCVLIGSNGCGKTTLADMLLHTDKYLYDGKIIKDDNLRMGYVSQFVVHEKEKSTCVFDYLCEDFRAMEAENERLCEQMGEAENFEEVYEAYQKSLEVFEAMDGYNYESNIHKKLKVAGLKKLEDIPLSAVSGGEYKLLQIIRQMLMAPDMLIMDEPDVFLDFENLTGLADLINSYPGTLLVITHNRYLLNHCFDKILHLEAEDLQEFEGNYAQYTLNLLRMKIEMQEAVEKETAWIEIQEKLVEKLRAEASRISNPAKGKQVNARAAYLERLKASRTKEPFVNLRIPDICLPELQEKEVPAADAMVKAGDTADVMYAEKGEEKSEHAESAENVKNAESAESVENAVNAENAVKSEAILLSLEDYSITFDAPLLSNVTFDISAHDKVAIVGANGTGKTTMLREIWKNAAGKKKNPAIRFAEGVQVGFLSQLYGDTLNEDMTILEQMSELGFETEKEIREFLSNYCFEGTSLNKPICVLSGGEKNLLQLAEISLGKANLLILDEPTSHLDTWSQIALEKAIETYKGAVLMVSHDFYTVTDCADYILYVDNGTIRRMSSRAFRKLIYRDHFDKSYLELEQKKQELEARASVLLEQKKYREARAICDKLETILDQM